MQRAAGEPGTRLLPVLQWPGSKARLATRIIPLMRPHDAYIEPFAGSLSVLLAKPPAPIEVVNDANRLLMAFYAVLRDPQKRQELIEAVMHTPYARDELRAAQDDISLPEVERLRRFFVRINQAYVSSNGLGNWTATYQSTSRHSNASKWVRFQARLWAVAERLQGVQIENRDAFEMLARMTKPDPDAVVYADPPYLVSVRAGSWYQNDMTLAQHELLAEELARVARLGRQVLISGYASPEYRSWYRGWTAHELAHTKTGEPGKGSRTQIETVWVSPERWRSPGRLTVERSQHAPEGQT